MPEAVFERHDPPACTPNQHNPGCASNAGYTEICEEIPEEGICVCIHWPPIEDFRTRDDKPTLRIVDNRRRK